jgi:hypothetical protein
MNLFLTRREQYWVLQKTVSLCYNAIPLFSPHIKGGFLNKCYIILPYSEFSAGKCHRGHTMVKMYVDIFILVGNLFPILHL